MTGPMLATSRLALAPARPADAAALHAHWTDAAVRRYLWDDVVLPEARVAALVAESRARFEAHRHGLWTIRLRDADTLTGCGGFWPFHDPPRLELVLSLSPACWGQGYATEACRALLAYARDALGMRQALASTDAPNAASRRLLGHLGFALTHRSDDGATLFYARRLGD